MWQYSITSDYSHACNTVIQLASFTVYQRHFVMTPCLNRYWKLSSLCHIICVSAGLLLVPCCYDSTCTSLIAAAELEFHHVPHPHRIQKLFKLSGMNYCNRRGAQPSSCKPRAVMACECAFAQQAPCTVHVSLPKDGRAVEESRRCASRDCKSEF